MTMQLREFCEQFVFLKDQPISFANRGYLRKIYASTAQRLVLRCSRQVEKTTLLVNRILHYAVTYPGIQMLLVCPRREQASVFSNSRLMPAITGSPFIRRVLLGRKKRHMQVTELPLCQRFGTVHSGCISLRGRRSRTERRRALRRRIPRHRGRRSGRTAGDAQPFQTRRRHPNGHAEIDRQSLWRAYFGSRPPANGWFRVPVVNETRDSTNACSAPAVSAARNAGSSSTRAAESGSSAIRIRIGGPGTGSIISWCRGSTPTRSENARPPTIRLASKTSVSACHAPLGDHIITREEIEACCSDRPMAKTLADVPTEGRDRLIAGIDWGGGTTSATVLVIGYMRPDLHSVIVRMERFRPQEEPDRVLDQVAEICRKFGVRVIAADGGGNGHVYNRLLQNSLRYKANLHAIIYGPTDQEPFS